MSSFLPMSASYRNRLPLAEAIGRLRAGAGSRYDEAVVELLGRDAGGFERLLTDPRLRLLDPGLAPPPPRPEDES